MHILRSDQLEVSVDAEHGGQITKISTGNVENMLWWSDSQTPVRADRGLSYGSTAMDWLSGYRGGWQGLIPNAGADSELLGVPLPFHGDTSTSKWTVIESDGSSLLMEVPSRLPLLVRRSVEVQAMGSSFTVRDTIINTADFPVPFVWGHHPAWLVDGETSVDMPESELSVSPDFDTELNDLAPGGVMPWPYARTKSGEQVDVSCVGAVSVERLGSIGGFTQGWAAVRRESLGVGLGMRWDVSTFPFAWMWVEIGGQGFPWFGSARIIAIEPMCTSVGDGLAAAFARGEAHTLEGGESRSTELSVSIFSTVGRPVRGFDERGNPEFG
jgi:hypothetical protein